MRERIIKHKNDTTNVRPREKPDDELSRHFFEIHGGWYVDGVQFQLVKIVEQGDFPDIKAAMESCVNSMMTQLSLFEPTGMNLRKEDKVARRNSLPSVISIPPLNLGPLPNNESKPTNKMSRWSRLDYFHSKPKNEELTDLARLLLQQAKLQEENENEPDQPLFFE